MEKNLLQHISKTFLTIAIAVFSGQSVYAQFTPGEGGTIPSITPYAGIPNKVSGLIVRSSQRDNYAPGGGTRAIVDLEFPEPVTIGASTYTLQYSDNNGSTWQNYQYNNADLTSDYNNFSVSFFTDYKLRLLVNGGPKNGYTSNEVSATLSTVETYFSYWSIDESMFLTGIMTPYIGRGLETSFKVKKLSDGTVVAGGLSYQWYRVNPFTYEMALIEGATDTVYTTTNADAGAALAIRATGDGLIVGGFIQIISGTVNVISNKAFVNSITNTGFTLNLFKNTIGLTASDFTLKDKDNNPVIITAVTQGENAAIYNIAATLDKAYEPYYLENTSSIWRLSTENFMHLMPGVQFSFDVTSGLNETNQEKLSIYKIPASNLISLKANCTIQQVTILNLNGQQLMQSILNSNQGNLNVTGLKTGIYLFRIKTNEGLIVRKVEIEN